MRKIKEVLRLKWEKGFSARQIAQSCDIARSTVKDYLDRAQLQGLTWPLPDDLAQESAIQMDGIVNLYEYGHRGSTVKKTVQHPICGLYNLSDRAISRNN